MQRGVIIFGGLIDLLLYMRGSEYRPLHVKKKNNPQLSDTSSLIGSSGIISPQYKQPQAAFSPSVPFSPLRFLPHINSEECESKSRLEKLVKSVPPPEDLRTGSEEE